MRSLYTIDPISAWDRHAHLTTLIQHALSEHPCINLFKKFLGLLSQQQLAHLDLPNDIYKMLENPLVFIDEHINFIKGLGEGQANTRKELYGTLRLILEKFLPSAQLQTSILYMRFRQSLTENDLALLPAPELLKVVAYRPNLLWLYPDFIKSIGTRRTLDGQFSLLEILCTLTKIST